MNIHTTTLGASTQIILFFKMLKFSKKNKIQKATFCEEK
jgi:hypothetical protein